MYRLIRSLNNNAALVKDDNNQQVVIMGLGLTFQKKRGDIISPDKIEKVFSLKNDEMRENFLTLLKDVPLDFITVTYEVIDSLVKKYDYPVQNYIYVTLTDHIYCAYKMVKKHTYQSSKLPDISKQYSIEYEMARDALNIFRKKILDEFPDDEVSRIALHLINAKGEEVQSTDIKDDSTKILINEIQYYLKSIGIIREKNNSNFYDRLMIHLTYFINALDRKDKGNNSILSLEKQIIEEYPKAYIIGSDIYQIIKEKSGYELFKGEKLYIVLHIQRLI